MIKKSKFQVMEKVKISEENNKDNRNTGQNIKNESKSKKRSKG